jgi:hypothetical protein
MFERAVLETIRNRLVESPLTRLVNPDNIIVNLKDEPPPTVGSQFVLIVPKDRNNNSDSESSSRGTNYVLDRMGFDVICGARTSVTPTDRLGLYLTKEYMSLSTIKDIVITIVSQTNSSNNNNIATFIINKSKEYPSDIQELLCSGISIGHGFEYINADAEPQPRYADYFNANNDSDTSRPAGHTLICRFLSPSRIYSVQC